MPLLSEDGVTDAQLGGDFCLLLGGPFDRLVSLPGGAVGGWVRRRNPLLPRRAEPLFFGEENAIQGVAAVKAPFPLPPLLQLPLHNVAGLFAGGEDVVILQLAELALVDETQLQGDLGWGCFGIEVEDVVVVGIVIP